MDERTTAGLNRYLPQVALATMLVAVCPVAVVWVLGAAGVLGSLILSAALSMGLAMAASCAGSRFWSSRPGSRDLLFSELMLWGWLHRLWVERRLSSALRLLGDEDAGTQLGMQRRGALLAQLATALEARDPYTHGHSRRVARHSATIAKRMGLSRHEAANVRTAAVLHDIGKMSTPNAVLRKPGELTDAEFAVIKEHPVRGAEMVSKLGNGALTAMVRHHHERVDGTGYPDGLAGSSIPLGARIIAVADTFDAITSARPYRAPRTHRTAIAILNEQAGGPLDPDAVRAFQSHYAGQRPLAAWVALTSVPQRLVSLLGGGVNVATGSAARVVATSALTGAAAVTAVVDSHPAASRPSAASAHGTLAAAVSSASTSSSGWQPTLALMAQPALAVRLTAQNASAVGSIVLAAQRQGALSASGPVQIIGAIGVTGTLAAGSPGRGVDQLAATGQGRAGGLGGLGGQGVGAGRVPGVPGGDQTQVGGGGEQSPGPGGGSRGPGGAEGLPSQGGDGSQTGGSQTTSPGDGQTPTTGDAQTPGPGDGTTAMPVDSQTPTPGDGATQPPVDTQPVPVETQTIPVDTQPAGQGAGGNQSAGGGQSGGDGSSSGSTPVGDQTPVGDSGTAGGQDSSTA